MLQHPGINSKQPGLSALQQLSLNGNRLGNKVAESVTAKCPAVGSN